MVTLKMFSSRLVEIILKLISGTLFGKMLNKILIFLLIVFKILATTGNEKKNFKLSTN